MNMNILNRAFARAHTHTPHYSQNTYQLHIYSVTRLIVEWDWMFLLLLNLCFLRDQQLFIHIVTLYCGSPWILALVH